MKSLKYTLLVFGLLFFFSCSSDDDSLEGPTLSFISENPHISSNTDWFSGTPFSVKLKGESNTEIKAITFQLNGSNITSSDISINGVEAESNPYFIPAQEKEFLFTIGLTAPETPGIFVYKFIATDVENMVGSNDLTITIK